MYIALFWLLFILLIYIAMLPSGIKHDKCGFYATRKLSVDRKTQTHFCYICKKEFLIGDE